MPYIRDGQISLNYCRRSVSLWVMLLLLLLLLLLLCVSFYFRLKILCDTGLWKNVNFLRNQLEHATRWTQHIYMYVKEFLGICSWFFLCPVKQIQIKDGRSCVYELFRICIRVWQWGSYMFGHQGSATPNTRKRHTSMPLRKFEPTTPASERPQTPLGPALLFIGNWNTHFIANLPAPWTTAARGRHTIRPTLATPLVFTSRKWIR